jgi:hypothetical protein
MRFVVDRFTNRVKGSFPSVDFPINGNFIIKIPSAVSVSVNSDTDLDALLVKKAEGILAFYPNFSNIIMEDFLNASNVEVPVSPDPTILCAAIPSTSDLVSNPFCTYLLPNDGVNNGVLTSSTYTLASLPSTTDVIVIWEVFQLSFSETVDGISQMYYSEIDSDSITCEISFDNGANWEQVFDTTFTTLNGLYTGQSVKIRFINNLSYSDQKVWLGGYSILHT